jgi:hypothetical protein
MDPTSFCYWLQGFFEMTETNKLSEKQVLMAKEHLKLVFTKKTPDNPFDIRKFEKTLKEKMDEFEKESEKRFKKDKNLDCGTGGTICSTSTTRYC